MRLRGALASAADRAFAALVPVLTRIVPVDRRRVLLGARFGEWYMDNTPDVFEWVVAHRPDLRPVWCAHRAELIASLRSRGLPVVRMGSLRHRWLLLRAAVGVVSHRLEDLAPDPAWLPGRVRVLFATHGKSVKRTRLAALDADLARRWAQKLARWEELVAAAASTSPFVSELTAEAQGIPLERFVVTGYPRNDLLLEPPPHPPAGFGIETARMTVLYAPTWRHGRERTRFFPFPDLDLPALRSFLADRGILLLVRPHVRDLDAPVGGTPLAAVVAPDGPIRLCGAAEVPDVTAVLPFADVLISDYSSIYHDFLLLDRPLVFLPYDLEAFEAEQGFAYDYRAHLPGPALATQAELCAHLEELAAGGDPHAQARRALTDLIHTHRDAGARARTVAVIDDLRRRGGRP